MPAEPQQRPVPLLLLIGSVMVTITIVEVLLGDFDRNWLVTVLLLAAETVVGVIAGVAIWTAVTMRRS